MPTLISNNLSTPNGVTFDDSGNLYITSLISTASFINIPPSIPAIFKIDPSGNIVGQLQLSAFANPKLEFIPGSNILIALEENGLFAIIDSTSLTLIDAFDLNGLFVDASAVLDVSTGFISDLNGFIQNGSSTYGDFDIRATGNTIQFFITGLSQAQTLPFVLRIELENGSLTDSKVLFSSTADAQSIAPQSPRLGRGIAVNSQGTVLTTLPLPTTQQPIDFRVAFNADIEVFDGIGNNEFVFVDNQVDIYSQGMTTDASGNFYIATNSVGSGVLGVPGEGALIVVSPNISDITFAQGIGLIGSGFLDVAINPVNGIPFVTINDPLSPITGGGDLFVSFPEAIPQAQLTSTGLLTDTIEPDSLVAFSAVQDNTPNPPQDPQSNQVLPVDISMAATSLENPLQVMAATPIQIPEAWLETTLTSTLS
jgi:hypothetical protein